MQVVPYIPLGDPHPSFSARLILALAPLCDIIEVGIPFSDPIADGKTIQAASIRALSGGMNTEKALQLLSKLRCPDTQFVVMTYCNILYAYGLRRFFQRAREIGIAGVIVPDAPYGCDESLESTAEEMGVPLIFLLAPNTDAKRAREIIAHNTLYTYLVAAYGTTGARHTLSPDAVQFIRRVRTYAGPSRKLFVGFGISHPSQARACVAAGADGVIVGSALIDTYARWIAHDSIDTDAALTASVAFIKRFVESV